MTHSPKKYVSSYTNCTAQRGVEAKEAETVHADLDETASNDCAQPRQSTVPEPPSVGDETPSYLQVVVEKHRRGRSPRLPAASSPLTRARLHQVCGAGGDVYLVPHAVLLACAPQAPTLGAARTDAVASPATRKLAAPTNTGAGDATDLAPRFQKKSKKWKILSDTSTDNLYDNEPECVEVYYFEQSAGTFLATCGGSREAWCQRASRRPARYARAILAEMLAAPALLAAAPLALLLAVQRCGLLLARTALTGTVQTASDYALKPTLALIYNALLQPLLVFVGNVGRGVRAALLPLSAILGDITEPLVRVVGATRLVEVRHCSCTQPDEWNPRLSHQRGNSPATCDGECC